jgi:hypothetical protein
MIKTHHIEKKDNHQLMANRAGPVLYIGNKINDAEHLKYVEKLVERGHLSQSDYLIWSYIHTYRLTQPDVELPDGVYFRIFKAFDLLEGHDNPDYENKKKFKFGTQTRYNRIKLYRDTKLLSEYRGEKPDGYKSGRITYLEAMFPALAGMQPKPEKAARTGPKPAELFSLQPGMKIDDNPIKNLGTFQMFGNLIGRCVRLNESDKRKTLNSRFNIPAPVGGETGYIEVVTSALDNSNVMTSEDLILVEVVYSKIKQLLHSSNQVTYPLKNSFTLDVVSISSELEKRDSGSLRENINTRFERVSSTEFMISCSGTAKWLMEKFQFYDADGMVFDRKRIRWLEIQGEAFEKGDGITSDIDEKRCSRYITISLPSFLYDSMNEWLKDRKGDILPMFSRDKALLTQHNAGQIWTLNNYLNMIAPKEGDKRSSPSLKKFLTSYVPHVGENIRYGEATLISLLTHTNRLLFASKLSINSRKQARFHTAVSFIEKHLIIIKNMTPLTSQLSKIEYSIYFVKMNAIEIKECLARKEKLLEQPLLRDDDWFLGFANNVYERQTNKHKIA